ncbi:hypothetical protein GCM10027022_18690 [Alpinimonas psychrophila]|uniref:D-3-phosphoglycerate dehydrogenase n=1 Tax=Alpinimonas psychrophila TaxID=748908 RepID=A0A7W3PPK5_9MICO|nr:C-terminal binding protein [Alpinimonas psychrophila]MBA8829560.1 D-3-phosphoglycerate dehydrogenase [Alpinimonas psychrophila]
MSTKQVESQLASPEERTMSHPFNRAVYTDLDGIDFTAGIELLEANGFSFSLISSLDSEEIISASEGASALLVGYAEITREMIERMPSVRIIALMSMGFDNVDVEAASDHGIWVTNILGAATEEVATHALALTLNVVRGISLSDRLVRSGHWNAKKESTPPRLSDCTLGVIGLGRIGSRFAEIARPLFREVIGYDPLLPDTSESRAWLEGIGVRRVSLYVLSSTARVVSLHLPLTSETVNMIDSDFLSTMPKGSFLINVSRGGLINSQALANSLTTEHLAGAALDVLDVEPPPSSHPLLQHPKAVITPHNAYLSDRSDAEYVRQQAQNIVTWARCGRPDTPIIDLAKNQSHTS